MSKGNTMERHFDSVAAVYDKVRNTDPAVADTIILNLPSIDRPVDIADIGCGTGRYTRLLAERMKSCRIFCCDFSHRMLKICREHLHRQLPKAKAYFSIINASELPFGENCFDAVTTFNAIHHFDLDGFLRAATQSLRPFGILCIYTRTPEQNARTIWGKHFPEFANRETRLLSWERIEGALSRVAGLSLELKKDFKYHRVESKESLLNRARNAHYSTFALYPREKFREALETFAKRLTRLSRGGLIRHTAENTLIMARRS